MKLLQGFSEAFKTAINLQKKRIKKRVMQRLSLYAFNYIDTLLRGVYVASPSPYNKRSTQSTGAFLQNISLTVDVHQYATDGYHFFKSNGNKSLTTNPFKKNKQSSSFSIQSGLKAWKNHKWFTRYFVKSFCITSDVRADNDYGYWKNVHQTGWHYESVDKETGIKQPINIQPYSPFKFALKYASSKHSQVYSVRGET